MVRRVTYREENMTSSRGRKREDYAPGAAVHSPTDRDQRSARDDYPRNYNPRNGEREPELLQDLRDFLEEVASLHLLNGSTPGDVQ